MKASIDSPDSPCLAALHPTRVDMLSAMRAKDLMVALLPTLPRQASLAQISSALLAHDMGAVLVLDTEGGIAGIVTDGDLFRRRCCGNRSFIACCLQPADSLAVHTACSCLDEVSIERIIAENVMSQPVIAVDEHAPLSHVAELLMQHGIRRIPVTRNGLPVGMLGRRNVLRALLAVSHDT